MKFACSPAPVKSSLHSANVVNGGDAIEKSQGYLSSSTLVERSHRTIQNNPMAIIAAPYLRSLTTHPLDLGWQIYFALLKQHNPNYSNNHTLCPTLYLNISHLQSYCVPDTAPLRLSRYRLPPSLPDGLRSLPCASKSSLIRFNPRLGHEICCDSFAIP